MNLPLQPVATRDDAAQAASVYLEERLLQEVFAYVSRRVWRREEAEDITAETIQSAYVRWNDFRGHDRRLWILGIARRKTADAFRRRAKRKETTLPDTLPAGHAPDDDVQQNEQRERLRAIVLALPDDQREALLLQHLEGLKIDEIAVVMGRRPAAVNSLLQRARARAYREGRAYFLFSEDRS